MGRAQFGNPCYTVGDVRRLGRAIIKYFFNNLVIKRLLFITNILALLSHRNNAVITDGNKSNGS
jgi:hypothetical protein